MYCWFKTTFTTLQTVIIEDVRALHSCRKGSLTEANCVSGTICHAAMLLISAWVLPAQEAYSVVHPKISGRQNNWLLINIYGIQSAPDNRVLLLLSIKVVSLCWLPALRKWNTHGSCLRRLRKTERCTLFFWLFHCLMMQDVPNKTFLELLSSWFKAQKVARGTQYINKIYLSDH